MTILYEHNKADNESLRQYAEHVLVWDNDLKKTVSDMWKILKLTKGVGLAAPQIGINKRIVVINPRPKKKSKRKPTSILMINPDILECSGEVSSVESCLSCPKTKHVKIQRHKKLKVSYYDLTGSEFVNTFDDDLAVIVQHEIDHLNGKLISDYLRDYKVMNKTQKGIEGI